MSPPETCPRCSSPGIGVVVNAEYPGNWLSTCYSCRYTEAYGFRAVAQVRKVCLAEGIELPNPDVKLILPEVDG